MWNTCKCHWIVILIPMLFTPWILYSIEYHFIYLNRPHVFLSHTIINVCSEIKAIKMFWSTSKCIQFDCYIYFHFSHGSYWSLPDALFSLPFLHTYMHGRDVPHFIWCECRYVTNFVEKWIMAWRKLLENDIFCNILCFDFSFYV